MYCLKTSRNFAHFSFFLVAFSQSATAQPTFHHWLNPNGGIFSDFQNWDSDGVPGVGGWAIFDIAGTYQVDFSQAATAGALLFEEGNVTFTQQNNTVVFNEFASIGNSNPNLGTPASLIINDGQIHFRDTDGDFVGLNVGRGGDNALLRLVNGAQAQVLDGSLVLVGSLGGENSSVEILEGSSLHVARNTVRGGVVGGNLGEGSLFVSGTNSTFTSASQLQVGEDGGTGTLTIENGGRVESLSADSGSGSGGILGIRANSSGGAFVRGANSLWETDGGIVAGFDASGHLTIESGGMVQSRIGSVGRNAGAIGTVEINGPTSEWTISQSIGIGGSEFAAGGQGTVTLTDGGTLSALGQVNIWQNGTLQGDGVVEGNVSSFGTISPGTSPGILTVNGNLELHSGSQLAIEIAGNQASQFDQLNVLGDVILDGVLNISLIGGFTPIASGAFTFLTADSITGTLDDILIDGIPLSDDYQVIQSGGTLNLLVTVPEPSSLVLLGLIGIASLSFGRSSGILVCHVSEIESRHLS